MARSPLAFFIVRASLNLCGSKLSRMKKPFFSLLWLLLFSTVSFAQNGNYFLSHYTPSDEKIDYRSSAMTQDDLGVIYFTNKNGVLEFDGKYWKVIPTPGASYIVSAHKKEIYVGGLFGFGKLSEQKGSVRKYLPLVDVPNIFSCLITEEYA